MSGLLEQAKAAARILAYLTAAYVVIKLWQDPSGSAHATMNFIEGVGHFFASLINKISLFIRGLGGD